MSDTLSRREYDQWIRDTLADVFTPAELNRLMLNQYPKDAAHATAELRRRGVVVGKLDANQAYSSADLDRIVETADLCGTIEVKEWYLG